MILDMHRVLTACQRKRLITLAQVLTLQVELEVHHGHGYHNIATEAGLQCQRVQSSPFPARCNFASLCDQVESANGLLAVNMNRSEPQSLPQVRSSPLMFVYEC